MSFHQISITRLFHSRGPDAMKLLSPICDCVRGTVHVWTSDDLKCQCPTSVTSWQSSDKYGKAKPNRDLYTSSASLKSVLLCLSLELAVDTSNIHNVSATIKFWHLIISWLCCLNDAIELLCSVNIFNAEKSVGGHVKKSITSTFPNRITFYSAIRCIRFC